METLIAADFDYPNFKFFFEKLVLTAFYTYITSLDVHREQSQGHFAPGLHLQSHRLKQSAVFVQGKYHAVRNQTCNKTTV